MTATPPQNPNLFDRGSWPEARRIGDILRKETIGGILLLAGAVIALIWANSPWAAGYTALVTQVAPVQVGPLYAEMTLAGWVKVSLAASVPVTV